MVTDNERYAFHIFIKKFIKQINSIRDIHIFVFYFGLINGCCYSTNTLANYANLSPSAIDSIINDEALKFNKVIHSKAYTLQYESSHYIIKLLQKFPSQESCMNYAFYQYLCDITYIPIDIIFPFMVKILSPKVPSNEAIRQKLYSFPTHTKKLYSAPFEKTVLLLKDFMYYSLYEYKKSAVYGKHPYFTNKNSSHKNKTPNANPSISFTKSCKDYKALITWPNNSTTPTSVINLDFINPLRSIKSKKYNNASNNFPNHSGEFYSSKLQRMVYYDSMLEYKFYHQLEADNDVIFYCEQPFSIPYFYNAESLLYIPDVFIAFIDYSYALVEIKALEFMANTQNLCKYRALKQYCQKYNWGYLMFDLQHSLYELETRSLNTHYVEYMLLFLQKKPLTLNEYQIISTPFAPTYLDLIALAVQNNLNYHAHPFSLERTDLL